MTEEFNKWWNADQGYDGVTNPYRSDSAVYWAWEGWQAGAAAEREACAKLMGELTCMGNAKECFEVAATYIRARGKE